MPKKTDKSKSQKKPDQKRTGVRRSRPSKRDTLRRKLPNFWQLTKATLQLLWRHKKLFLGITAIYGLLNLVLVQGLASHTDVASLKNTLNQVFTGEFGSLASGLSIFAVLVASAGNGSSPVAGAYQTFLALITSLAVIWALRQILAGNTIRIRDTFYKGMYPLVPFILVLLVIGVQLIPALIGSGIYSIVNANGIAVHFIEQAVWLIVFIGLLSVSLYFLTSSILALYIVTLPDMTPVKALRSARELIRYRRWTVLRKLLCLPLILLIGAIIIMLPIILWLTALAQWVFFLLTMFGLVFINAYLYNLYRELLDE